MRLNSFKKPWLHFLLIGALLYILQATLQTVPRVTIQLPSEERIAELRGQWLRSTGYPPSAEQVQQLVDDEINQEILFQQALRLQWHLTDAVVRQRLIRDVLFVDPENNSDEQALFEQAIELGLHENDLVVRRRLVQRMEMMAYAPIRLGAVDEQALQSIYENNPTAFVQSPRIKFRHVFISSDRHAEAVQQARSRLQQLSTVTAESSSRLSDPFLHGLQFNSLNESQIARYFGADFSRELFQQVQYEAWQDRWLGPITSSYGEHLVWIEAAQTAQQKPFAEVRKTIVSQWRREREQQALNEMIKQLRREYGFDQA